MSKSQKDQNGYSVKIILIGDGGAGKTSLVNRFVHKKFSSIYKTTIGVDITPYQAFTKSGEPVRFVLWDMSGQTHFKRFRARFYTGTSGAIVVYDITNATSLKNVQSWIKECNEMCHREVPIAIIGNKADLDELQIAQFKAAPRSNGEFPTIIASAKNNWNVEKGFFTLFETVIGKKLILKEEQDSKTTHVSYEKD